MSNEGAIQVRYSDGTLTFFETLDCAWAAFESDDHAEKLSFPFCGTRLILRRDENSISGLRAEVWQSKKFGLERIGASYEVQP